MRVFNRLLVVLMGLALIGAGVIAALEVVLAGVGQGFVWVPGRSWLHELRTTPWSASPVVIAFSVLAGVGVLLFVVEIRPWRERRVPLDVAGAGRWWLLTSSLEAALRRRIAEVSDDRRSRAKVKTRGRRWRIRLSASASQEAGRSFEQVARAEMARLGCPVPQTVRARVKKQTSKAAEDTSQQDEAA